ncbi:MAG: MBL fold metallo-hydrolase [Spirochaetia bacterium]|jgi:glyoxylase-like metal-dependent hydrolase (beta-lactamase superfamily II)|nr:MBL fold metallo-hydrolase [Spirochaetales bacterium]MDX9783667.1 MBL fold metallo-hydrolase [Spirochaetia bacterium]
MKIYQHYSIYGFSNGYVICNEESMEALVVDPGEVTTTMIDQIESKAYTLKAILITHSHIHHCRGLKTLMRIYHPDVYASNAKLFNLVCKKVQDQQDFQEASFPIRAIAVPGHSQDSIVYDIDGCLFTGDAFHAGIIGKTTSAFNAKALFERLKSKLESYPDDSLVFPGHGPPSTLGTEKKFNLGLREGFAESLKANYDFFV